MAADDAALKLMKTLSPRRNTSTAHSLDELVAEQMAHFGVEPSTELGQSVARVAAQLYQCQADVDHLWRTTLTSMASLDRADRIAHFNAKKFLSFQFAKLLDTLQNPFRSNYQSLGFSYATQAAKGPYAMFDNVTAIFSATPVITRTATYVYACAEWIEDAFQGKELLLEIYSRLLNPTSVSLANFIVDIEAGPYANEYFAWNFDSGMAAIDGVLSHLLGRDDILITSRNIYGGAHQLIHDWYAKPGNLAVAVETFDGYGGDDFDACWQRAQRKHAARLAAGRQAYVFLDVPDICRRAHAAGLRVILDATVGTPFLVQPLQRENPQERPDFVMHSYTKDLSGVGSTVAGVIIGRNEDMFIPKGQSVNGRAWNETMFWNVYYVKGAFLNADAAFEVIQGMRTLTGRMLQKCITTQILARFFASHPQINVHCSALAGDPNHAIGEKLAFLGLPAPLFTINIDGVPRDAFERFFDSLAPAFDHMISLGQSNTIVSCPALTTHSELSEAALSEAGIHPTTIRFAVGDEDPHDLMRHFLASSRLMLDPCAPGFSSRFMGPEDADALIKQSYVAGHDAYIRSKPKFDTYT
jgi:O-acetylhomoserine (thiol)-lyase